MKKIHKRNVNVGLASALALGTVVAVGPLAAEARVSYSDVKETDHYYNAVVSLAERGIIKGFEDGTFRPGQSVTRGQAAKIIAGILKLNTTNVVNPGFKDVPTTHQYYGAIAALANAGIINGYPDGTYGPGKAVQRNHMAKIIAGAFKLEAPAGSTIPFKDVSSEYSGYITALYATGITTGKTATTFDGASNVTRGQLAAFVVRAENTTPPKDVTATEEVTFTIDAVIDNTVGGYKVSDAVKSILNEINNEALADALVSVNVRNNEIVSVNSIQLNTTGTAESPITLDGANVAIAGNLTINADYIEVKNLTVKGDVSITKNVVNEFNADGLVSQGQLIIEEGNNTVASLLPIFADNTKGPKVSLKNSEVKNVNVKRQGITLESDTKLGEVQISAKVSSIQLNADAGKVVVDVTVSVEITGQGAIDEVRLVKVIEVALKMVGSIGKLAVSDSGAKVEIAATLTINTVENVKDVDIKDIIKNYSEIKGNIKEIVGLTPSTDNSSGGQDTPPVINPAPKPTPEPPKEFEGEATAPYVTSLTLVEGKTSMEVNQSVVEDLNSANPGQAETDIKNAIVASVTSNLEEFTADMIDAFEITSQGTVIVKITAENGGKEFTLLVKVKDDVAPTVKSVVVTQPKEKTTTVNATINNGKISVDLGAGTYTEKIEFTFSEAITGLATGDKVYLSNNEYGTVALSEDNKTLTISTIDGGELNEDGSNSTGHLPANATGVISLDFVDEEDESLIIKDLAGNVLVGSTTITIKAPSSATTTKELEKLLGDNSIKNIKLGFDAGDITVNRLVNIDLNGHSVGHIKYATEETGVIHLTNSGKSNVIETIDITAPEVTFNLGSGITVNKETNVNNVAVGTFNTEATHNGTVLIKDPDGGSVNFTNATVSAGIEIKPDIAATKPLLIRGEAPTVSEGGNGTVKILGEQPKVVLEGTANEIIIEARNTEFELSETGDATNITIDKAAVGSKITASKYYEFELLFEDGQKVEDIVDTGLFGDQQIRVVGYPEEGSNITEAYLLKLDTHNMSTVYTIEEDSTLELEMTNVQDTTRGGLFKFDKDGKKLLIKGNVTGGDIRKYLTENNIFDVDASWLDGKVVMSFYNVFDGETALYPSESSGEDGDNWDHKKMMRVLVGTNERHGLYILTKNN